MTKVAIIGASYLQEPLIRKAKERGYETHVFAWKCGDVGEYLADYFYPISIVEKDLILEQCRKIGINGICSIASDLAIITVNYVANGMGLTGNSLESTEKSTNKHKMRKCFELNKDPSPRSILVSSVTDLDGIKLDYPVIVKPLDRSGSRGITKLDDGNGLQEAIEEAKRQGFQKQALVEEFVSGQEYSVEYVSWNGNHRFLAITRKYTTGSPHFIETGHLQPAALDEAVLNKVKEIIPHALSGLGVKFGASHSEIKITDSNDIKIIEIGARMGGDFIGSSLVQLSTGYDFVGAVLDISLGIEPAYNADKQNFAAVRFVFSNDDIECFQKLCMDHENILISHQISDVGTHEVVDSSSRFGYFLFSSDRFEDIETYLPGD